jgi:hypothetical protein
MEAVTNKFEQIDKIAKALATAALVNPVKNKVANMGKFKNHYADLSVVIDTVRPALSKVGLSFTQLIEPGVLITCLMHDSGQCLTSHYALPTLQDSQAMGSAITYARRYSLCSILGIAAEDDEDGTRAAEAADQEMEGKAEEARMKLVAAAQEAKRTAGAKKVETAKEEGRLKNAHTGEVIKPGETVEPPAKDEIPFPVDETPPTTTPPPAGKPKNGPTALAGIAPNLAQMMSQAGISPDALSEYAVQHLARKIHPKDFPPDYIGKMLANWDKVKATVLKGTSK